MKYFVVSDIHGYLEALIDALGGAGFFECAEPKRLVVCGDLLDRGPDSRELCEFMLALLDAGELIYVRGNHEDLLINCLTEIASGRIVSIASGMSHHYANRTWHTALALSDMGRYDALSYPDELVRRVMASDFYERLLTAALDYFETPNYIFTHGWIPAAASGTYPDVSYSYRPDWREADNLAWERARWYNGMSLACTHGVKEPGKTIVCGHWHASFGHVNIDGTSTEEWGDGADTSPFYADGIIAIDSGVAVSGRLNCLVIED